MNDDLDREHNYIRKLNRLKDEGKMPAPGFWLLEVVHDGWCSLLRDERARCNCDPDIRFVKEPTHDN